MVQHLLVHGCKTSLADILRREQTNERTDKLFDSPPIMFARVTCSEPRAASGGSPGTARTAPSPSAWRRSRGGGTGRRSLKCYHKSYIGQKTLVPK